MFEALRSRLRSRDPDRRVRAGRVVGLVFIAAGFAIIAKAWDGAASIDFVSGQMPYLLSGGFAGLGLIVTGAILLLLSGVRAERRELSERLDETSRLLARNLSAMEGSADGSATPEGRVLVAGSSYHRAGCRVLEGKADLQAIPVERAVAESLTPCRVCAPPEPETSGEETEPASPPATETPSR